MATVPPGEPPPASGHGLKELERLWDPPKGWRMLSAVNNTIIGFFYLGTALLFFLAAGVLGLLIRTQLAVPGNDFLPAETYNQIFTMHGTVMMFLFAVPAVEAAGILLLPQMLGARDLPFPRLGAFAFWAYLVGGVVFFCTIFFGLSPSGGWFMYPPLTNAKFSPGIGADFWLLGIGFIEISAIAGAIEIIVGILRTRAPGMSLDKMPVFAWTMLIFAVMVIFAFPAVILATMMLELERAFGWPFFEASKGGDPLLWQHLFWFFGHPEVYIIFLPAAGMVSMIVATMTRHPLVGHDLIVIALIATGFFSFGLWVHHMFTTGIPGFALGLFSAASMAVSVPSGIQVFSWIATIAAGRLRITTPSLFVIGFLLIFTIGGLTGVMVAMVPFDWQVHDSYFVVAHFHYVLIGGMVFPLFGAIYYWVPAFSRRPLSERLGRWAFALTFLGFNLTFLPMHLTGLLGMPRRVYTYPADVGWSGLNLTSTIGAYLLAIGILVLVADIIRHFRPTMRGGAGNIWQAGTLEWLPNEPYGHRSIGTVTSRNPLWDQPELEAEVQAGKHFLPGAPTGTRETLVTSPTEAKPEYVLRLPGPGWSPFVAALGTAGFFLLLTVQYVVLAFGCGFLAIGAMLVWCWGNDPAPAGVVGVGRGLILPTYAQGPSSHSWWAMATLLSAAAALYLSFVFGYLYIWAVAPTSWPSVDQLPASRWPIVAAACLLVAVASATLCRHGLRGPGQSQWMSALAALLAALGLLASLAAETTGHWVAGLRPTASAYGALVYLAGALQTELALAALVMSGFLALRLVLGMVDAARAALVHVFCLLIYYTAGQGLLGLLLIHGFPRLLP